MLFGQITREEWEHHTALLRWCARELLRQRMFMQSLTTNEEAMMATLDDVLRDVTDEGTKLDSLGVLVAGLKQQIADALSGVTLPPETQAKVDAVFTAVESNKAKVQSALDANVTAQPSPPAPKPAPTGPDSA